MKAEDIAFLLAYWIFIITRKWKRFFFLSLCIWGERRRRRRRNFTRVDNSHNHHHHLWSSQSKKFFFFFFKEWLPLFLFPSNYASSHSRSLNYAVIHIFIFPTKPNVIRKLINDFPSLSRYFASFFFLFIWRLMVQQIFSACCSLALAFYTHYRMSQLHYPAAVVFLFFSFFFSIWFLTLRICQLIYYSCFFCEMKKRK